MFITTVVLHGSKYAWSKTEIITLNSDFKYKYMKVNILKMQKLETLHSWLQWLVIYVLNERERTVLLSNILMKVFSGCILLQCKAARRPLRSSEESLITLSLPSMQHKPLNEHLASNLFFFFQKLKHIGKDIHWFGKDNSSKRKTHQGISYFMRQTHFPYFFSWHKMS